MPLISIVTACFNEQDNVRQLYEQVKAVIAKLDKYDYEHIFIDNASTDNTLSILKDIAENDKRVKIIVNNRNFEACDHRYLPDPVQEELLTLS